MDTLQCGVSSYLGAATPKVKPARSKHNLHACNACNLGTISRKRE
jgi:hypothetical protein